MRSARGTLPPRDDRGGRRGQTWGEEGVDAGEDGRPVHARRVRTRAGEERLAWRCSHAEWGVVRVAEIARGRDGGENGGPAAAEYGCPAAANGKLDEPFGSILYLDNDFDIRLVVRYVQTHTIKERF